MLLNVSVKVNSLFEQGKAYSWPKPDSCPKCKGRRLWGHGNVQRYFIGFTEALWIKRYRCPECKAVHTMRPLTHWRRFQYSAFVILRCLLGKLKHDRWQKSVARQNQQYWYRGLKFQASRYINTKIPTIEVLQRLVLTMIIPVSHSNNCEILRL